MRVPKGMKIPKAESIDDLMQHGLAGRTNEAKEHAFLGEAGKFIIEMDSKSDL